MSIFRTFIEANQFLSKKFDLLMPPSFRVDGNMDFIRDFAPKYLRKGQLIVDIGAGKQPYLSIERKRHLQARVVGIDISQAELNRAPPGSYDEVVCADITKYEGSQVGDIALCQSLLEHVQDTELAIRGIASTLRPGGMVVLFVPCRNALFARLNLLLPEDLKRTILFTIFPKARHDQGFKSYYHRCTPDDFREISRLHGLRQVEFREYYMSAYFSFFFPAFAIWRIWTILARAVFGAQAAETFCMALKKE